MNVFSLKILCQESSETESNCLCEEVGTLSESTIESAECDKPRNFTDMLFGSEAQQITCFHKFVLLTRTCILWCLRD